MRGARRDSGETGERLCPHLGAGLILLYRSNVGNGGWMIKAATVDGNNYWTKAFAFADDFTEAGTSCRMGPRC